MVDRINISYCPNCKKQKEARWSFGRTRCLVCKTALDDKPIVFPIYVPLGSAEISRRTVEQLYKEDMIDDPRKR